MLARVWVMARSLSEFSSGSEFGGGGQILLTTVLPPCLSAIIIGSPPAFRGGVNPPRDLELKLLKMFPQAAYFIEKVGTYSHFALTLV